MKCYACSAVTYSSNRAKKRPSQLHHDGLLEPGEFLGKTAYMEYVHSR